ALGSEHGVGWIKGHLFLCWITDKTLLPGECYETRCRTMTMVIGDYFYLVVSIDADTRERRSQVDPNCYVTRHHVEGSLMKR
ncbi:hypothetical protein Ciccas_010589, partial [Cichlidogyrus casuarinus]